jgi:hypothetical protein
MSIEVIGLPTATTIDVLYCDVRKQVPHSCRKQGSRSKTMEGATEDREEGCLYPLLNPLPLGTEGVNVA